MMDTADKLRGTRAQGHTKEESMDIDDERSRGIRFSLLRHWGLENGVGCQWIWKMCLFALIAQDLQSTVSVLRFNMKWHGKK